MQERQIHGRASEGPFCCDRPRARDHPATSYQAREQCLPTFSRLVGKHDTSHAVIAEHATPFPEGCSDHLLECCSIFRTSVKLLFVVLNSFLLLGRKRVRMVVGVAKQWVAGKCAL